MPAGRTVVFLDECGIRHGLFREYAWSKRGEPAQGLVRGSCRARTNVIGAWSGGRFLAPMVLDGAFDREAVDVYFQRVLLPRLPAGSLVVLDNASFHRASNAEALAREQGIELLYLPPYSPDLNPIERFWARLKRRLRPLLPESNDIRSAIADACAFFDELVS